MHLASTRSASSFRYGPVKCAEKMQHLLNILKDSGIRPQRVPRPAAEGPLITGYQFSVSPKAGESREQFAHRSAAEPTAPDHRAA
jgi:hypothetical protein